ncbi:hypothetical protein Tco_1142097, partial [Tanacetum coccineum]
MGSNEETNAAGTDTRPPMLVESDYDSWKIRIHRYIRGKPNGKLIWKSIQNGPTPHPMITDPPPTNSTVIPAPKKNQGLPRHIFNILNQTSTAQEIWNNVELLMQGSGRTLQQLKEDLFDEYERFRAIGNESIHDYFMRFHKLALTTTNMFQANHEDAYDSDVDEGPNVVVAFMANLSSTSATNNPVNVGTTEGSCDQQALETDRIQLQDTITSLRIQLDGLKVEHVSLNKR